MDDNKKIYTMTQLVVSLIGLFFCLLSLIFLTWFCGNILVYTINHVFGTNLIWNVLYSILTVSTLVIGIFVYLNSKK